MTKLKMALLGTVIITGVVTSLVVHQQARARLREQDDSLRRQSDQLAQLNADHERLANLLARTNDARDPLAELLKLRAEADSLRRQTNDLATLREANRRLRQRPEGPGKTPLQIQEEQIAKMKTGRNWLLALMNYAMDHQNQFPTNFAQAASAWPRGSNGPTNPVPDQFEIVYLGSTVGITNPGEVIFLREKQPWLNSDGKWVKVYGNADGSVQVVGMPSRWRVGGREVNYETFEAYEKDHMIPPPGQ